MGLNCFLPLAKQVTLPMYIDLNFRASTATNERKLGLSSIRVILRQKSPLTSITWNNSVIGLAVKRPAQPTGGSH